MNLQFPGKLQAHLHIGAYKEVWPRTVLPLHSPDVTLGTAWLKAHEAVLDCEQMSVAFTGPQGHMTVAAGQALVDSYIVNSLTLERYLTHEQLA